MKVAITGSTGLIGAALVEDLRAGGHQVVRLVRREPGRPDEARWNPYGRPDPAVFDGVEAVVHLAGAGIGDRYWTRAYKMKIRDSRVEGTRTLAEALAGLGEPPRALVCGSAVGYYGDGGDEVLDEDAPRGEGFLAGLVEEWEAAARPAADAGIRVVHPRAGVVLTGGGGMLGTTLPLFRLGLGGRMGRGRQWMAWISLPDQIAALRFLIDHDLSGPVNLAAPQPVTNAEYTKEVGRAVRRPAPWIVPRFALRLATGGFSDEAVFVSQRVVPRRLGEAGFAFAHPELSGALDAVL